MDEVHSLRFRLQALEVENEELRRQNQFLVKKNKKLLQRLNSDSKPDRPAFQASTASTPPSARVNLSRDEGMYKSIDSWNSFGFSAELLRGIYSSGYETPTPSQQRGIKPMIDVRHIVLQGGALSGKSTALVIGALSRIDPSLQATQVLMVVAGREMAFSVQSDALEFGQHMQIKSLVCIGGTSVRDDKERLSKGPHFVVGTTGRVLDMIKKRVLSLDEMKVIVLDDVDDMFSRNLHDQTSDMFTFVPPTVDVALSATVDPSPQVIEFISKFMRDPLHILVENCKSALEQVRQFYVDVGKEEWKVNTLCHLYRAFTSTQVIIYCTSKKKVDLIAEEMRKQDVRVETMHADGKQNDRDRVMHAFLSGSCRVLVCTDWLHRQRFHCGCQVGVVVNFDLPSEQPDYFDRLCRRGRLTRKHVAVSLVTEKDWGSLKDLERHYSTTIEKMPMDIADLL